MHKKYIILIFAKRKEIILLIRPRNGSQNSIIMLTITEIRDFIQDEEQDEDMISQYTATYNALEKWESDKRETQLFDSLAASELIRQLNK